MRCARQILNERVRELRFYLLIWNKSCGAAGGTRTPDPLITNEVRYQLCHCGDTRAFYSSLFGFPTPFFTFWSIFSRILRFGWPVADLLPRLSSMGLHPREHGALEWPVSLTSKHCVQGSTVPAHRRATIGTG